MKGIWIAPGRNPAWFLPSLTLPLENFSPLFPRPHLKYLILSSSCSFLLFPFCFLVPSPLQPRVYFTVSNPSATSTSANSKPCSNHPSLFHCGQSPRLITRMLKAIRTIQSSTIVERKSSGTSCGPLVTTRSLCGSSSRRPKDWFSISLRWTVPRPHRLTSSTG